MWAAQGRVFPWIQDAEKGMQFERPSFQNSIMKKYLRKQFKERKGFFVVAVVHGFSI